MLKCENNVGLYAIEIYRQLWRSICHQQDLQDRRFGKETSSLEVSARRRMRSRQLGSREREEMEFKKLGHRWRWTCWRQSWNSRGSRKRSGIRKARMGQIRECRAWGTGSKIRMTGVRVYSAGMKLRWMTLAGGATSLFGQLKDVWTGTRHICTTLS